MTGLPWTLHDGWADGYYDSLWTRILTQGRADHFKNILADRGVLCWTSPECYLFIFLF